MTSVYNASGGGDRRRAPSGGAKANTSAGPADRFLHVCYCCSAEVRAEVCSQFVDQLAFRHVMSASSERSDGSLLGFDHDIVSGAAFVYDHRGPRSSPAVEIQGWVDPPVYGSPADDPTALGIQALGVAVNDLEAARERLDGAKCTVVGRGRSQFGTPWISMQDVTGVALDLVEDSTLSAGKSRLAHLRVACSDLARSVSWYEGLGFEVLAGARVDGAAFLGMADQALGRSVRLRLRAEPFEVILTEWETPSGHGHHPENANHAGLFRAAIRVEHPGRRTRP